MIKKWYALAMGLGGTWQRRGRARKWNNHVGSWKEELSSIASINCSGVLPYREACQNRSIKNIKESGTAAPIPFHFKEPWAWGSLSPTLRTTSTEITSPYAEFPRKVQNGEFPNPNTHLYLQKQMNGLPHTLSFCLCLSVSFPLSYSLSSVVLNSRQPH